MLGPTAVALRLDAFVARSRLERLQHPGYIHLLEVCEGEGDHRDGEEESGESHGAAAPNLNDRYARYRSPAAVPVVEVPVVEVPIGPGWRGLCLRKGVGGRDHIHG